MEKYIYNYGFLRDWFALNRLTRREVGRVLGNRNFKSFNEYLDGQKQMPVDTMLKICNAYGLSPALFIVNTERLARQTDGDVALQSIQAEPTGNDEQHLPYEPWERPAHGRGSRLPQLSTPLIAHEAAEEGEDEQGCSAVQCDGSDSSAVSAPSHPCKGKGEKPTSLAIVKLQLDHERELRALEHQCEDRLIAQREQYEQQLQIERNRWMAIVASLAKNKEEPSQL